MAASENKLKRITVPRRILLLLYDHQKFVDNYETPEVVTQSGIANELSLRQNHVSRALRELISGGFIFTRSAHITGLARRRFVYFLTENGFDDVQDYISESMQKTILVHITKDKLKEYTLTKVTEILKDRLGYTPSIHQILTRYYDGTKIDINLIRLWVFRASIVLVIFLAIL